MSTFLAPEPNMAGVLAQARMLGHNRGLVESGAGWPSADPTPLSGEWADDPTMATLARSLGVRPPGLPDTSPTFNAEWDIYAERCLEVAEAYETGYQEAWETGL